MEKVAAYYSSRIREFGETPRGVDWKDSASQEKRFRSFSPLIESVRQHFSVVDFGSGYGAYADYLMQEGFDFRYFGVDISEHMRLAGTDRFADNPSITFVSDLNNVFEVDLMVSSGTFNVKLDCSDSEWLEMTLGEIESMWRRAKLGIAVNFLSQNAESNRRETKLFYADPARILEFFNHDLGALTMLDHSYSRWEFTAIGWRLPN